MSGWPTATTRIAVAIFVVAAALGLIATVHQANTTPTGLRSLPRAESVLVDAPPEPTTTAPTTTPPGTPPTAVAPAVKATVAKAPVRQAQADQVVFSRTPAAVGQQALALITYPWRDRLQVAINFTGARSGMRAETTILPDHSEEITVFVRSTDTVRLVAVNIAHELGHLIDYDHLTDAERQEWLNERGRPDVTWNTCNYCTDYRYGSGDFAETFAAWQVGPVDYRSQVAPLPSADEFQRLARFFH
jgi:hypothetical protein